MFGALSSNPIAIPKPTSALNLVTLRDAIGSIQKGQHDFIKLRENHLKYIKLLNGGQDWRDLPDELQEEAMSKSYYLSGGKTGFYRRFNWDKPSPTLVTHPTMPATMLVHPDELRPLSIQEYALIQQFPKDWKFVGKPISVYKQIGNAVPVELGYMAGKAIMSHINGEELESYHSLTSRYKGTSSFEFMSDFEKRYIINENFNKEDIRENNQIISDKSFL